MSNPYDRSDPVRRDAWDDGYAAAAERIAELEHDRRRLESKLTTLRGFHHEAVPEGDPNYPCPGIHKDNECIVCGIIDCPEGEPLHYHHDSCPAEWATEQHIATLATAVTTLRLTITGLLLSADCAWEERGEGHDWAEACQQARSVVAATAGLVTKTSCTAPPAIQGSGSEERK